MTISETNALFSVRSKRGAMARNCDNACKRAYGICPPSDRQSYMMGCNTNCEMDYDCSKGSKCCESSCGKMCMQPLGKLNFV